MGTQIFTEYVFMFFDLINKIWRLQITWLLRDNEKCNDIATSSLQKANPIDI